MCLWNSGLLLLGNLNRPGAIQHQVVYSPHRDEDSSSDPHAGIVPCLMYFLMIGSLTPTKNAACLRLKARGSGPFLFVTTGAASTAEGITGDGCGLILSCADRSNSLRNSVANLSRDTSRSPALNLISTLNIAAPPRFRFSREFYGRRRGRLSQRAFG